VVSRRGVGPATKVPRSVLAKADVAVVNVGAWYNPPDRPQYERDARDMGPGGGWVCGMGAKN